MEFGEFIVKSRMACMNPIGSVYGDGYEKIGCNIGSRKKEKGFLRRLRKH